MFIEETATSPGFLQEAAENAEFFQGLRRQCDMSLQEVDRANIQIFHTRPCKIASHSRHLTTFVQDSFKNPPTMSLQR